MIEQGLTFHRYVDSIAVEVPQDAKDFSAWMEAQCEQELQSGLAEGRITFDNLKEYMQVFETTLFNKTKGYRS